MKSSRLHPVLGVALLFFLVARPAVRGVAAVPVIDDAALWQGFADTIGRAANDGGTVPPAVLRAQLEKPSRTPVRLSKPARRDLPADTLYARCSPSVVGIAAIYKCGHCPHWHTAGTASGFVVGERGEIASNYHVFAEDRATNVVGMGILTRDGRAFPVREVLWADRARDIAVVRTDATGLRPLPLEVDEPVGRPVSVIAHPGGDLFTLTQGHVARYMRRPAEKGAPAVDWMCVTADYAVGSSGGPVFNARGAVVGMVARTQTIAADPRNGATTQMVVKMTVPAASILDVMRPR